MPRYATRNAYCKLCQITRQALSQRIKAGKLTVEHLTSPVGVVSVIDTEKYPPQSAQPPGRKPGSKNKPTPTPNSLP